MTVMMAMAGVCDITWRTLGDTAICRLYSLQDESMMINPIVYVEVEFYDYHCYYYYYHCL